MADNTLDIILTAKDEASEKIKAVVAAINDAAESIQIRGMYIQEAMKKAAAAIEDFGNKTKQLGKMITNVGQNISFFGAGILAPFILAIKNSADNSKVLKGHLDNIKNSFDSLQLTLATAVLPIVERFANALADVVDYVKTLNPAVVSAVAQAVLLGGAFAVLAGATSILLGKVLVLIGGVTKLAGAFLGFAAANPILLVIVGSIGLVVAAMLKWKWVADTIMSTFEVIFLLLNNGFLFIGMVITQFVQVSLENIQRFIDLLAMIPGPTKEMFQGLSDDIQAVTDKLKQGVADSAVQIEENTAKITEIFRNGTGQWSETFDKGKNAAIGMANAVKSIGTESNNTVKVTKLSFKQMAEGLQASLGMLSSALQGAAQQNKAFAIAAKASAIGMAIVNTALAFTKTLATYGGTPAGWIFAAMVAAAGAIQIATIASTPLASGGIVTGPTQALIGEAGPEAVIPLSKSNMFGSTQYINIEINNPMLRSTEDINLLAEEISTRLARESERT